MKPAPERPTPAPACPICGKPARPETQPFCSRRCADVDLGRWFGERYRVPTQDEPEAGDAEQGW
jgi:endogenous inhibitor of DNA gyrase (YacG/DUF329 family)